MIAPGGKKDPGSHYYLHIDQAGKLLVAGGCYLPPPDVLLKIRRRIADKPAAFTRMMKNPAMTAYFSGFADEGKLARLPKGFAADTPHIEFIKQKEFHHVARAAGEGHDHGQAAEGNRHRCQGFPAAGQVAARGRQKA